MMITLEFSKHDLMAAREFLLSSRDEGRYAYALDHHQAAGGVLRARVNRRRERRGVSAAAHVGSMIGARG